MYNQGNYSTVASNNQLLDTGKCMGILRVGVILWLFLPLIILIINRFWHAHRSSHYPAAHTGRVVEAVYSKGYLQGAGTTQLTYAYRVMGIDYIAHALLDNQAHKAGDEIHIRYNLSQPAQSIVWEPTRRRDWLLLFLMWISLSLGSDIFAIFISIFTLVILVIYLRKIKQEKTERGTVATCSISFTIIFLCFLFVAALGMLLKDGFWQQNWLRGFWYLAFGLDWNSVAGVVEFMVVALVLPALGGIFIILRKKMNPWLAFIIAMVIFIAIVFGYVILKTDYIEPLLTPQALK
jgi:hypothetical protein